MKRDKPKMIRTQIQLTSRQADELKRLSAERGGSIAEWIRRAVDVLIRESGGPDREALKLRALAAVGAGRSGLSDVADRHDTYLDDAFDRKKP